MWSWVLCLPYKVSRPGENCQAPSSAFRGVRSRAPDPPSLNVTPSHGLSPPTRCDGVTVSAGGAVPSDSSAGASAGSPGDRAS